MESSEIDAPKDFEEIPHPHTRAEKDLHLWNHWQKTNHPNDMKGLLRAFDPLITKFTSQYRHSGIPHQALEAEAKINAVKAFKTYDPSKGTQLNTHVTNYLQKTQRLVMENKELTRIPEHRQTRISTYMNVRDLLRDKLGRDPNMHELHDELAAGWGVTDKANPWSTAEIERMEKELHKTLLSSVDSLQENAVQEPSKESKLIDYVYYELSPVEKSVFEYLTGRNGKPRLDGISIAKKLNLTQSRVSRMRAKIAEKFEKYLD